MMISPNSYYEQCIKGKTKEQITKEISRLKEEIRNLKNTLEHPEYTQTMHPSEISMSMWLIEKSLEEDKKMHVLLN